MVDPSVAADPTWAEALKQFLSSPSMKTIQEIATKVGRAPSAVITQFESVLRQPKIVTEMLEEAGTKGMHLARLQSQAQSLVVTMRDKAVDLARLLAAGAPLASGGAVLLGLKLLGGALLVAAVVAGVHYGSGYLGEHSGDSPVEPGPQQARHREASDKMPAPVVAPTATAWFVWYADNIALKPVSVGTDVDFHRVDYCNDYPGGGNQRIPVRKVSLVEGARTREAAIREARSKFDSIFHVSATSTFVHTDWLGTRGSERFDVDELQPGNP